MTHFTKITAAGKPARVNAKAHAAVIDQRTGLMWTAKDVGTATFANAPTLIDDLNAKAFAGFTDWRLPTLQELFGIADHSRISPAIDTAAFPSCKGGWYWSSTVYASSPSDYAWLVSFYLGSAHCDLQGSVGRVRAVRSVSSPASGQ
ncbi:DUF1566 domain-containing protein [Rhodanobacter thiooxydans]|uniref:Lcl C-terminal domain-containing protein n=1 Tax=Rhodanobacter thiooxydans TaxID=416169 RepID=UPI000260DA27|nr:DUF1566 domain-containing protein [Rhodanobacter thiooxydans]EIL99120.1 hypothetical protein UUA_08941 [Rhodanobacter thiooxydans LCS2]